MSYDVMSCSHVACVPLSTRRKTTQKKLKPFLIWASILRLPGDPFPSKGPAGLGDASAKKTMRTREPTQEPSLPIFQKPLSGREQEANLPILTTNAPDKQTVLAALWPNGAQAPAIWTSYQPGLLR